MDNNTQGAYQRKPNKIYLYIFLIISTIIIVFLCTIMFSIIKDNREVAQYFNCLSNAKQLGYSFTLYASDNDNFLPPADNWIPALRPYAKDDKFFTDTKKRHSYAMYEQMSGFNLSKMNEKEQSEKPLLYSSPMGVTKGTGNNAIYPHKTTSPSVYVDGHAKIIPRNKNYMGQKL